MQSIPYFFSSGDRVQYSTQEDETFVSHSFAITGLKANKCAFEELFQETEYLSGSCAHPKPISAMKIA